MPVDLSVPWWKRKRDNPFDAKAFIGLMMILFGVQRVLGDTALSRIVGGLLLAAGLYLQGHGVWWRTDSRR